MKAADKLIFVLPVHQPGSSDARIYERADGTRYMMAVGEVGEEFLDGCLRRYCEAIHLTEEARDLLYGIR